MMPQFTHQNAEESKMHKIIILLLLALACWLPTAGNECAAANNVIYGCVSKVGGTVLGGNLRIVSGPTSCRTNETLISWNQAGPQGSQGVPGPQGPPGAGAIKVYDANERFLGYLLGQEIGYADGEQGVGDWTSPRVEFFVPSLGAAMIINKSSGKSVDSEPMQVFYESFDCTGAAFVSDAIVGHDVIFEIAGRNKMVLIRSGKNYVIRYPNSIINYDGVCTQTAYHLTGTYELIEIPKENIPFPLPVALPLRYEAQ
jgi:hypothetical protein